MEEKGTALNRHIAHVTEKGSYRIVLVDDDRDTADMLVWLLQMEGHAVIGCYAGLDAIEKACACRPDVVLLDLAMSHGDGYRLARQIRARDSCKDILLIAVTGCHNEADRQLAFQAGFDVYMVNPTEFSALAELLEARKYKKEQGNAHI
jgi:DNA-binding response OmpR family regulator